jgi:hypothetical protein
LSRPSQDPPPEAENVTIPIRRGDSTAAMEDTRVSTRSILLGLLCAVVAIVGILAGLKLFLGERAPDLTQETLQAALEKWQAQGPASYDLDVEIGGAQPGVAHVEIHNGAVTVATRDGLPLDDWNKDEWSIPSQFEMLEREFEFQEDPQTEMGAPPGAKLWLRCEFDPKLGYPRRFLRHATGGAPSASWRNTLQPK